MPWYEEEEEDEFEWKEEDEDEIPAGEGPSLSRISGVATIVLLGLLALGLLYAVLRVFDALKHFG